MEESPTLFQWDFSEYLCEKNENVGMEKNFQAQLLLTRGTQYDR